MTDRWPVQAIKTERLTLAPLRVEDADEMAPVLDDEHLHEFMGGHPVIPGQLRDRYRLLVAGSGDADETWLNWIVRLRPDETAIGTVQATITDGPSPAADVAWVIGVPWQGRGFAAEAAGALVAWLRARGVDRISANIHPDHRASAGVAARVGLVPTDEQLAGETIWRLPGPDG